MRLPEPAQWRMKIITVFCVLFTQSALTESGRGLRNVLAGFAGYRANVLMESENGNRKSFYEYLSAGARLERFVGSVDRIYLQYLYAPARSVTVDSPTDYFTDHEMSLGYKFFFGHSQVFISLGASYLSSAGLAPPQAYGTTFGGGLEFSRSRYFLSLTTQFSISKSTSTPLTRRSFNQSADLGFRF